MSDHINQQIPGSTKVFGVMKEGANRTDQNAIRAYQKAGYNEHEIARELGICFSVVRSFMRHFDKEFKETEAPVTTETKHLHDRIAELEARVAENNEEEDL